jgi:pilus assembly protein CpaF
MAMSLLQRLRQGQQEATVPPAVRAAEAEAAEAERRLKELRDALMDRVLESLPPNAEEMAPMNLRSHIETVLEAAIEEQGLSVRPEERRMLLEEFVNEVKGFGPLEQFLNDPMVTSITVNGPSEMLVERMGSVQRVGMVFRDEEHLNRIIRKIARLLGARVDSRVPVLDKGFPEGGRVRIKVPPLVPTPTLTIDKGPENPFRSLKERQERSQWQQDALEHLRQTLQERLMQELDRDPTLIQQRDALTRVLEAAFDEEVTARNLVLSRSEKVQLQISLINDILGYGPLQPLLDDPEISEIMVNGPHQIYVERKGKVELTGVRFRDEQHLMRIIEKILLPLGKRVDERVPMVDARLPDGSRVNIVIPPIALNGPCVTIRKFARDPFTMSDLIAFGTLTQEAAQFLQAAVQARLNIVISGGTGSGKTTLLNVLSAYIPNDERIITIEDTAELQLRQEHVVRLEARPPNIEGVGEVTIRDLVRNALRMRPDRIIVGECRGGEALDMLQAMNTGHDGSMTTIHANNPREAFARLETMVLMAGMDLPVRAIREQIAGALDLIIQTQRMRDGSRKVVVISEVTGMEGDVIALQDIFVFESEGVDEMGRVKGALRPTGIRPKCFERFIERGIRLPVSLFYRG